MEEIWSVIFFLYANWVMLVHDMQIHRFDCIFTNISHYLRV